MAEIKDSQLTAAQALADADILAVAQNVGGTLETRRTNLGDVKDHITGISTPVVTNSTTSLDATGANSGNYTRFTNSAAKAYVFDSTESYTIGAEYHGRNVGVGDLTLTEAGSFVLNPPADGTLVIPQGGTFTAKIVGVAEADVFGVTVAAP